MLSIAVSVKPSASLPEFSVEVSKIVEKLSKRRAVEFNSRVLKPVILVRPTDGKRAGDSLGDQEVVVKDSGGEVSLVFEIINTDEQEDP